MACYADAVSSAWLNKDEMNTDHRKKWKNYVGNQLANPLRYFQPQSLPELIAIIKEAKAKNLKVKAVGAGHSSSDIMLTDDYMIDVRKLNRVLDRSLFRLKSESLVDSNLFFVEAGIRLHDLNNILDENGKALINMGAYTGQALAGVISTSTHGSGIGLGAFPAYVRSMIIVDENGALFQIEPGFEKCISVSAASIPGQPALNLVTDDDQFNAIAVSMGCIGLIYAVVLEVRDHYKLRETRRFSNWTEVKHELDHTPLLKEKRHVEVLVSPYAFSGTEHKCLVTEREIDYKDRKSLLPRGHRKWYIEVFLFVIPDFIIDFFMRLIINHLPKLIPSMVHGMFAALTDRNYIDKSFKVLDLGRANNLSAYAMELSFPSEKFTEAVDAILELSNNSVTEGGQYLTGPVSLRFIRTNRFFLSMQYGEDPDDYICMIEFPTVRGSYGGYELLSRIESAMRVYDSRPHWGQVNHVGGEGKEALHKLYPKFDDWLKVYRRYCKAGRFQNNFTRRCGIEVEVNPLLVPFT
jgi:FAD/FMN-containing dehydrogenase